MKFRQVYFSESAKVLDVWYHGSKTDFDKFDLKYAITKNSVAKHGPGFYLSDSKKDAEMFVYMRATDGFIKDIKLTNSNNIKDSSDKFTQKTVNYLIDNIPEKDIVMSNWDENETVALKKLKYSITNNSKNIEELIINVWNECYVGYEIELCNILQKLKIDGILVKNEDSTWLVCYNPNILKIINTEKY
jgi:hypothetical protein